MRLNSRSLATLVVTILFGGILITNLTGWWTTESTRVPARYPDGASAGQYNPADIRGSYLFADIETYFGVPVADLAAAFALPTEVDPASFGVKDIEGLYLESPVEIGTESLRVFVALYAGLPYEIVGDVYLPQPAVDLLKVRAVLSSEQIAYLDAHAVAVNIAALPAPADETASGETGETSESDRLIRGKTTFQDLLSWGLPRETIENIIGASLPPTATKVRDYCSANGLSFETIKNELQAEVDRLP